MDRAVFTFYGRVAALASIWRPLDPMERSAFSIDKVNCKIESFCRRKYLRANGVHFERAEN